MTSTGRQRADAARGSFPRPNAGASARLPPLPRRVLEEEETDQALTELAQTCISRSAVRSRL